MTRREIAIAVPMVVLAIVLGVYPRALLDYSTPATDKLADNLTTWTVEVDAAAVPPSRPMRPRK